MAATQPQARYGQLVRNVTETVAIPHTYTLLIWCTTMITVDHHGLPDVFSILLTLAGACLAYVTLGRFSQHRHGVRAAVRRHRITHPYLVATGNIVTLFIATGICWVTSQIPIVHLAWFVTGVAGTAVYLLGVALQAFVVAQVVAEEAEDAD